MRRGNLNTIGGANPEVVVICDIPSEKTYEKGMVMTKLQMKKFAHCAKLNGLTESNTTLISPAPPFPEVAQGIASKEGEHLAAYRDEFMSILNRLLKAKPKLIVYMGNSAGRQLCGRSVKITNVRGTFTEVNAIEPKVLPLLSMANVVRRPEVTDIFESDFNQIGALISSGWDFETFEQSIASAKYEWTTDISDLLENPPKHLALDTETIGLNWAGGKIGIVAQLSYKVGHALLIPMCPKYYNKASSEEVCRVLDQLRELLKNPNIKVVGHNLKFDVHVLEQYDIKIANWHADTMQMAFCADDNMTSKSLDDCVRRWVPQMAGYADDFNQSVDKSRMDLVSIDQMARYAGGDTDACLRLFYKLEEVCGEDKRNLKTFYKIQMPALRAFADVESRGIVVNKEELGNLSQELTERQGELERSMLGMLSKKFPKVMRKHEGNWGFGRADFIRDILFTKDGYNLKPKVFTKTTRRLHPSERKASTSIKDHLALFEGNEFIQDLGMYQKLQKMISTYVGKNAEELVSEIKKLKNQDLPKKFRDIFQDKGWSSKPDENYPWNCGEVELDLGKAKIRIDEQKQVKALTYTEPSGFWQYLQDSNVVHPCYHMHRVVTGRTSCSEPNIQQIPKRGDLAKSFRSVFKPREGYKIMELDVSQAELRIAAVMSGDEKMLDVYERGGDIHSSTAAGIIGITEQSFIKMRKSKKPARDYLGKVGGLDEKFIREFTKGDKEPTIGDYADYKRFQAKAVNFGFLYGMGASKFRDYAKTDYGIDYSEDEAQATRDAFFRTYKSLQGWHEAMRQFVVEHKYVRALHGSFRRLPNIDSIDETIVADSKRQAINSPVQRFASDLGLIAMARLNNDMPKDKMAIVAFVHDALFVEAKEEYADEIASNVRYYMENPPLKDMFGIELPIPIVSDASIGDDFANMEEREDILPIKPEWYESGQNVIK